MIIHSGELNIDSQDVELCEDITQLKKWKLELELVILQLKNKLTSADYKFDSPDEESPNPEWYKNTLMYTRLQQALQVKVKLRMLEICAEMDEIDKAGEALKDVHCKTQFNLNLENLRCNMRLFKHTFFYTVHVQGTTYQAYTIFRQLFKPSIYKVCNHITKHVQNEIGVRIQHNKINITYYQKDWNI